MNQLPSGSMNCVRFKGSGSYPLSALSGSPSVCADRVRFLGRTCKVDPSIGDADQFEQEKTQPGDEGGSRNGQNPGHDEIAGDAPAHG